MAPREKQLSGLLPDRRQTGGDASARMSASLRISPDMSLSIPQIAAATLGMRFGGDRRFQGVRAPRLHHPLLAARLACKQDENRR